MLLATNRSITYVNTRYSSKAFKKRICLKLYTCFIFCILCMCWGKQACPAADMLSGFWSMSCAPVLREVWCTSQCTTLHSQGHHSIPTEAGGRVPPAWSTLKAVVGEPNLYSTGPYQPATNQRRHCLCAGIWGKRTQAITSKCLSCS